MSKDHLSVDDEHPKHPPALHHSWYAAISGKPHAMNASNIYLAKIVQRFSPDPKQQS